MDISFSHLTLKKIHSAARNAVATFSKNGSTKLLITQSVDRLNAVCDALHVMRGEMMHLASLLPEFEVVMSTQGAGEITSVLLQHSDPANSVFQFMDRKRAEGKHFYVYMVAGAAKFLRIYYARVNTYLEALDTDTDNAA